MIERSPVPLMPKTKYLMENPPGFTFLPNKYPEMPLIWYYNGIESSVHSKTVNDFFEVYDDAVSKNADNYVDCEKENPKDHNKSCIFRRDALGPCAQPTYGSKSPCIYLKLNKHPGWVPKYYGALPDKMPEELKKLIKASTNRKKIWVYCHPNKPADEDHLGNISYYPNQEIQEYYFPFNFQKYYLSPVVAVQINDVEPGYLSVVRCSVWADNIAPS
ncbi:sodium/potassium-transporting ATPase subunit beta-1-like [Agrilus planipennis]|uniref:Sodium/potassium-transporting ATPase subunit beta-1-like n=1 Tax=Agrilus planipennis TaxID=224129 RepID=A0A7F5RNH0_AGRPL|nr:sodium/potassium-transporting ATPase subunit beta-1-like [Agrilus planipennis]